MPRFVAAPLAAPLLALLLPACPTKPGDSATRPDPIHLDETAGCDDLVPEYCGFPLPSDRWLTEDSSTLTGYRLTLTPEVVPETPSGSEFEFGPYERLDGWSPASAIMALFSTPPDLSAAAWQDSIDRSLAADSQTVLLDLETGERIPHWVELDARTDDDTRRTLFVRLVRRLEEDRSYAVAFRNLTDDAGAPLPSSPAFAALRDGTITDAPALEARRTSYEAMFDALDTAGVPREELTLAWWFHTASGDSIRGDLLHIREDALARLGPDGIGCTVTAVQDGYGGDGITWRRLEGTFTVPSYMDSPTPPARFVRGDDGMPTYVEDVEVPFALVVPTSLVEGGARPGPLVTFGHGLMGDGPDYLTWSDIRNIAYRKETLMVATSWDGMSSEDATTVATALNDPGKFVYVAERLQQGQINVMALTRTFAGVCRTIPELVVDGVELIDREQLYFVGVSQGGILGATAVTISPDIQRGGLLVNGAIFPFMIERSIDFAPYFPFFDAAYPDRVDQAWVLATAELLWEHSEGSGYLAHTVEGLPGIGPKEVLSITVVNDAQVPNLASDVASRTLGIPMVRGSAREPWGIDVVDAPYTGSARVEVDMGDPPVPEGNLAPDSNAGGHSAVCFTDTALTLLLDFFRTGVVGMPCDGVCDPD